MSRGLIDIRTRVVRRRSLLFKVEIAKEKREVGKAYSAAGAWGSPSEFLEYES